MKRNPQPMKKENGMSLSSRYTFKAGLLPPIRFSAAIPRGKTKPVYEKREIKPIKILFTDEFKGTRKKRRSEYSEYLEQVHGIETALNGMLKAYEQLKKLPR